ncbi:uncharacterized protein [Musca autumnalis]|uniref:uncharacterized protein n=1 Tax=Musca autumnalis TaxID=221902 RepID=UPI003CE999AE
MVTRISGTIVLVLSALLLLSPPLSEAKRALGGGGRKTSSGGGHTTRRQPDTHVTKPTYSVSSGNSHADQAKLSYPNYNAQPNRPASAPSSSNNQPIGWNVPNNQHAAGPPPAYSPSNVAGGAKTNIHEPPPVYQKPNYGAPPPNYNQATGTHYGSASYPQQQLPAGATYHSPNNLPPGATLYNNPSHVPGGYPMAGGYPMGGGGYHAPSGGYYPANSVPAGASYFPAGGQLPPGAVMYSSPPQQTSSGLGFGSGLAAGAIGGAILGHVLTPSHTKVVEQAPAAGNAAGGGDRVIIINNTGQPINATDANGATIINAGGTPAPATSDAAAAAVPMAPLAPLAPMPAGDMNNTSPAPMAPMADGTNATNPEQPPAPAPGGIICVPVRVNATDPNDATKMMEVEQIACYPAPPPAAMDPAAPGQQPPADGSAPLAPMQPVPAGGSEQLQQSTLVGEQNAKTADSGANRQQQQQQGLIGLIVCFVVSYLLAY